MNMNFAKTTIAAVAALAAFLRERALKAKRPTGLTRALPAVADCEARATARKVAGLPALADGRLSLVQS